MNYFDQNIESLKKHYSEVYHKLIDREKENLPSTKLEIFSENAVNGEKILFVAKKDIVYRLNSNYHPSHEAQIWAEQYGISNIGNIITMFGLGNGTFAKEIVSRMGADDRLFIYEPSRDIFEYVIQEYDFTDIFKNKNIIVSIMGMNDFDFHNVLQYSLNITNIYSLVRAVHPYYEELFPESGVVYWKEIRDLMFHTQININTEVNFGPRFLVNNFHNMKYLRNGYILRDIALDFRRDLPAIIVAAGPSVQENLEELKRAKGKAYIFAVDRILDYLLDEGIEPDFVLTVDPIKPLQYFSRRTDIHIPLLTELSSNWEILEAHKGEKIFYNCNAFFRDMYAAADKYQPFIMTGASVSTVAFSICVHLGFERIVLVGHDLAYDGDITHAGGVAEDPSLSYQFMTEGIDGNEIRTRHDWKEFLQWYKDIIYMYPAREYIDTKKKGARIAGTVLMSLKEVLDQYGAKDGQRIEQLYSSEHKSFDEESFAKAYSFLEESLKDLDKIKKKAKEALAICDKQIKAYRNNVKDNDTTIKNFAKISKINKFIESKPVYDLVDNIIISMSADDLALINKLASDSENDKVETYQRSKNMYRATVDGVEYILPKLRMAIDNIR